MSVEAQPRFGAAADADGAELVGMLVHRPARDAEDSRELRDVDEPWRARRRLADERSFQLHTKPSRDPTLALDGVIEALGESLRLGDCAG